MVKNKNFFAVFGFFYDDIMSYGIGFQYDGCG